MYETQPKKIVVTGAINSGKTQLLNRLVNNCFTVSSEGTIGVNFYLYVNATLSNKIHFWDFNSQKSFLLKMYYKDASGVVFAISLSEVNYLDTLSKNIGQFLDDLKTVGKEGIPVIICLTKIDLYMHQDVIDTAVNLFNVFFLRFSRRDEMNCFGIIPVSAKNKSNMDHFIRGLSVLLNPPKMFYHQTEEERRAEMCPEPSFAKTKQTQPIELQRFNPWSDENL